MSWKVKWSASKHPASPSWLRRSNWTSSHISTAQFSLRHRAGGVKPGRFRNATNNGSKLGSTPSEIRGNRSTGWVGDIRGSCSAWSSAYKQEMEEDERISATQWREWGNLDEWRPFGLRFAVRRNKPGFPVWENKERSSPHSASDSSTHASTRRSTNPTATPTRTSPFMMAAIRNISSDALQVAENAPPLPFFPCAAAAALREPTILANDRSAQSRWPREDTPLWALSPPKEPSPPTHTAAGPAFFLIAPALGAAATAESAAGERDAAIAAEQPSASDPKP